jgi:hypothetical protein
MRMRFVLGLLLAPTLSNQTYAESMTTDFVIDGCRSADKTQKVDQFKLGLCLGAINALMTQQLNSFAKFCVPSSTTLNEAVRVVLKHVEANPDVRNQLFEGMVADALSDEWPCTHKQLQNEYERGLDEGTKQSTKMIAPLSDYLRAQFVMDVLCDPRMAVGMGYQNAKDCLPKLSKDDRALADWAMKTIAKGEK